MNITVVYAMPTEQRVEKMTVCAGTTARAAVIASAMDKHFNGLNLTKIPIGIYGEIVRDDFPLKEGDRIELYRALQLDPMEARRKRARQNRPG